MSVFFTKKSVVSVMFFLFCLFCVAGVAMATESSINIPSEIKLDDWESLMGTVLVALTGTWVGRKLISTTNKS